MSESKFKRTKKKQLGQFMTPYVLVKKLLENRRYKPTDKILEPSFGEGSFLLVIIEKLMEVVDEKFTTQEKLDYILENNVYGVELDDELYNKAILNIENKFGCKVNNHNLHNDDFFNVDFTIKFDYCEGNPPFGGTFETGFGEKLDKLFGNRNGEKIKKETYSFFTVKCLELLNSDGQLGFVSSDTFLSINTMKGLRKYISQHTIVIKRISYFSDETNYGMVYFDVTYNHQPSVLIDGKNLEIEDINSTPNFSFLINNEYLRFFRGPKLKDFIICSSGMTIGKNELFLKEIFNDSIIEKYEYEIVMERKTIEKELLRNKLGKLTKNKKEEIENGVIEKVLVISQLEKPKIIPLPHEDYKPYNKSTSDEIYSIPQTYVYWKNDGEAVKTYKKTGPWYLHGVGGEKFFFKEGFSWSLISDKIKARYLPTGYVLDSGAPVANLRTGIENDELYFIIGWLLTPKATEILKSVLNHTKNIQSKDIERMPYPFWVSPKIKKKIIDFTKKIVQEKINGEEIVPDYKEILEQYFNY